MLQHQRKNFYCLKQFMYQRTEPSLKKLHPENSRRDIIYCKARFPISHRPWFTKQYEDIRTQKQHNS